MTSNQIFGYDITIAKHSASRDDLKNWFGDIAKKWVFQEEKGDKTGYAHFQCRISLKERARIESLQKRMRAVGFVGRLSPTANNTKDFNYVLKSETRVDGPWCDKDTECEVTPPADIDHLNKDNLRPYQRHIYDACVAQQCRKTMSFRTVDFIYDPKGCIGKTVLTRFLVWNKLAMYVPVMQDAQDIMQWVMSFPPALCYIIDMPRSHCKDKLNGFWAGIEQLRSGFASDKRHKGRFRMQTPPIVWVFSNHKPDLGALSADRWNVWFVDHKMKLVRYSEERIAKMHVLWNEEKKSLPKPLDVWEDEPPDTPASKKAEVVAPKKVDRSDNVALSDDDVMEILNDFS